MRRLLISIVCGGLLLFGLAGCGKSQAELTPSESPPPVVSDSLFDTVDSLEKGLSELLRALYRRDAVTVGDETKYQPTVDLSALKQTWEGYVASSRVSYTALDRLFNLPVALSGNEEIRAYITGIDISYAENNSLNKNILEISLLSETESGVRTSLTYRFFIDNNGDFVSVSDLIISA